MWVLKLNHIFEIFIFIKKNRFENFIHTIFILQDSDAEKSDQDLVVDVANEVKNFPFNLLNICTFNHKIFGMQEDRRGDDHSLDRVSGETGRENGPDKGGGGSVLQRPPSRSGSSSSRSTPKSKDVSLQTISFVLFEIFSLNILLFLFHRKNLVHLVLQKVVGRSHLIVVKVVQLRLRLLLLEVRTHLSLLRLLTIDLLHLRAYSPIPILLDLDLME